MRYEGLHKQVSEQLIALEHEGWRALVAGNGGAYYRTHLTANAVMAFPVWTPDARGRA